MHIVESQSIGSMAHLFFHYAASSQSAGQVSKLRLQLGALLVFFSFAEDGLRVEKMVETNVKNGRKDRLG